MFLPGMKVPGGENTETMPVRAFGAPQTTCTGEPCPVSTMQTRSRSAFGCCFASITRAMMKRGEPRARVVDALDLQADPRQRLDDLVEGGRGVEVVLEPGEGEFHGTSGRLSAACDELHDEISRRSSAGVRRSARRIARGLLDNLLPTAIRRESDGWDRSRPICAPPAMRRTSRPIC